MAYIFIFLCNDDEDRNVFSVMDDSCVHDERDDESTSLLRTGRRT